MKKETNLPHKLSHRDLSILPSRFGYLFFMVLGLMLISSVNDNNNLGYLLTFLLTSMMLVSIVYTYRNLLKVELLSLIAEPVFAGETAVFRGVIKAGSLERHLIKINFKDQAASLVPKTNQHLSEFKVLHKTKNRGLLDATEIHISSIYPFGLFKIRAKLKIKVRCVVYPKPISHKLQENYTSEHAAKFESQSNSKGNDDFSGLKSYQAGDSLKHIFWKALARGQDLKTKEFSGTTGSILLLSYEELTNATHENKLSYLSDMALQASRKQIPYSMQIPSGLLRSGQGEAHLHKCLEALALC